MVTTSQNLFIFESAKNGAAFGLLVVYFHYFYLVSDYLPLSIFFEFKVWVLRGNADIL